MLGTAYLTALFCLHFLLSPSNRVLPNLAYSEDSKSSFEFYLSILYKCNLFYVLFNCITQSLPHKQGFIFHEIYNVFSYVHGNHMKWKYPNRHTKSIV